MSADFTERRKYPRVDAAFPLRLEVEIGADGSTPARGTTVNLSRGGMLAAVDRRLPLASHCRVHFLPTEHRVEPTVTSGVVLRVTSRGTDFLVAMMFDEPLERLSVARTAWRKQKLPHRGPSDG